MVHVNVPATGPVMAYARGASKTYVRGAQEVPALDDVDLEIREGEFCSIVGPSGCGKTTLLRLFAGLETPSAGEVGVHDDGTGRPSTAVAFQEYGIFPWKSVLDNVTFGLRMHGVAKREAVTRSRAWIDRMGLTGFENAYPAQLSGGMKQRVSLARALALDPSFLLLDEPFAALDAQLRSLFQEELLRLWEEGPRRTALFVTHSLDEALFLSDRVVLVTARPAQIKRVFEIPFPRPRSADIRNDPEFARLRAELWELLREEVTASSSTTGAAA